eukprot:363074-Chlamydomonas_euryale.AAC.16
MSIEDRLGQAHTTLASDETGFLQKRLLLVWKLVYHIAPLACGLSHALEWNASVHLPLRHSGDADQPLAVCSRAI